MGRWCTRFLADMNTETVQIVDGGRGPQLSTSRITALDVFLGSDKNGVSRLRI